MGRSGDVLCVDDNRTLHLGLKEGEISPLILTVGCHQRARFLAETFLKDVQAVMSPRLFITLTGYYKNVRVSIVGIGMGVAAMDFLIREAAYLLQGQPLVVVRVGTCGIFVPGLAPGTLMVAEECVYCHRNYIHFDGEFKSKSEKQDGTLSIAECKTQPPYLISAPVKADPQLTACLEENIKKAGVPTKKGLHCSAETFYACQGRTMDTWDDKIDSSFVERVRERGIQSMDMETHQLFHLLAHRSVKSYAAAVMHGIVNRSSPEMGDHAEVSSKSSNSSNSRN